MMRVALERNALWVQEETQVYVRIENRERVAMRMRPLELRLLNLATGAAKFYRESRMAGEPDETLAPGEGVSRSFLWSELFPDLEPGEYELTGGSRVRVLPATPLHVVLDGHEFAFRAYWKNGEHSMRTTFVIDEETTRIETTATDAPAPAPRAEPKPPEVPFTVVRSIVRAPSAGPIAALFCDRKGDWWLSHRSLGRVAGSPMDLAFSRNGEPVLLYVRENRGFEIVRPHVG